MKRNKQIGAVLLAFGITFITGCGGGSSGSSDNKYVLIMHRTPSGVCENPLFTDLLKNEGFEGLSTEEYDFYDKDCWDYQNARACEEDDYNKDLDGAAPADCVIKFDDYSGRGKKVRVSDLSPEETTWAEKATSAISASIE